MKGSNKISNKLNELIILNDEVEKAYAKILKNNSNSRLISFFEEKMMMRNEFGKLLMNEKKKLNAEEDNSIMLERKNKLVRTNYRNLLQTNNNRSLQNEVYRIEQWSIEKYNELLMEMNLPLTLCKLLMKQRDIIQYASRLIEREDAFIL